MKRMEIKEFDTLERKIKEMVESIGKLNRENQRLKLKIEDLETRSAQTEKTEDHIREKVGNLIQIIDSIQTASEK